MKMWWLFFDNEENPSDCLPAPLQLDLSPNLELVPLPGESCFKNVRDVQMHTFFGVLGAVEFWDIIDNSSISSKMPSNFCSAWDKTKDIKRQKRHLFPAWIPEMLELLFSAQSCVWDCLGLGLGLGWSTF